MKACRVCLAEGDHPTYIIEDMMVQLGKTFAYFECGECGCLQIETIPDDLSPFYDLDYHGRATEVAVSGVRKILLTARNNYAAGLSSGFLGRMLLALHPIPQLGILRKVVSSRATKILDVGCGSGNLLRTLSVLGFSDLHGIDAFSIDKVGLVDGVQYYDGTLDSIQGSWDLIMFHHSLEHMADQEAMMRAAWTRLNYDGRVIVRIPLSSSHAWRTYKENWVQIDAPRHFYLHTVSSFELLAGSTGFRVEKVIYDSSEFQFWGSEQYKSGVGFRSDRSYIRGIRNSIFDKSDIVKFKKMARKLNESGEGDQAAFVLSKKI